MKDILKLDIKSNIDISKYSNAFVVAAMLIVFILASKGLLSNYASQQKTIEKENKSIEEKKDLMKKWEAVENEYERLSDNFLKDPELLKKILEQNAQKSSIRITSFRSSRKEDKNFSIITFKLKADCSYSKLVEFLQLIEGKGIEIERINLSRDNKQMKIDELVLTGYILKK